MVSPCHSTGITSTEGEAGGRGSIDFGSGAHDAIRQSPFPVFMRRCRESSVGCKGLVSSSGTVHQRGLWLRLLE